MLHPYTLRVVLRLDTANAQDICQIAICYTTGGKRKYFSTGLRINKEHWSGERVKSTHGNAVIYNAKIQQAFYEAEAKIITGQPLRGDGDMGDFHAYAEALINRWGDTGKIAKETYRRNLIDINHVKTYCPTLRWVDITPVWLHNFNTWLLTKMQQNSAVKPLACMRKIFGEAKRDGTTTLYPFGAGAYSIPAEVAGKKQYLTIEELDKIEALLDKDHYPAIHRSTIAHFLLECYSGIRHGDWKTWRKERLIGNDSLALITNKTGVSIYLPLGNSPRLKAIIDRIQNEGLDYKYSNQDANRRLKMIADAAGIDKNLTTHVGRHTAGTMLLEKGLSRETVAEVLGVSMKVIDIYAKMTRQKVKAEFERVGGL